MRKTPRRASRPPQQQEPTAGHRPAAVEELFAFIFDTMKPILNRPVPPGTRERISHKLYRYAPDFPRILQEYD